MDLTLNSLKYFEAIVATSNISRAAEQLGITQPALSVALKKLEEELGTPLLIRNRSGVQLTHAGTRLRDGAGVFLGDWKRLRETVLRGLEEVTGNYVIGCHPSVALYSLPQLLPHLLSAYNIEIRLIHDLSRRITESVISYRTDFGIVVNPWSHPDLVIRPLWEDTVTLYRLKKPSPLQNCEGEGVLICDPDLMQSQSILQKLSKAGLSFRRVIYSSSLEVITALTKSGAGVGILPGRVASACSDLVSIKAPTYSDKIALIFRQDRQHSNASKTLAREMERILKSGAGSIQKRSSQCST